MVSDFTQVGEWLLSVAVKLWTAFGTWQFLGFAIIALPIIRKLVKLFGAMISTI